MSDRAEVQCPVCWHGHLDYDDESCVSCGCDWVFIRDRYDEGMKQRLAAALAALAPEDIDRNLTPDQLRIGLRSGSTDPADYDPLVCVHGVYHRAPCEQCEPPEDINRNLLTEDPPDAMTAIDRRARERQP